VTIPVLILLVLCYGVPVIACAIALARTAREEKQRRQPAVSIIIAARDEEEALPGCLESLGRLTYPRGLLEVIIVDDGSTDRTGEILRSYCSRIPFLRYITAGSPHGKVGALASGIEASSGEILMFTDADCLVPPGWVEETVRFYSSERIGLVAGFTLLEGKSGFARLQALDWVVLFSLASAAVQLRFPLTAVGNNLSVRRAAYDATGGYRSIPFSVTEDFALFKAVRAAGWDVRFPLHSPAMVRSSPCSTVRELLAQKKRWFLGGVGMEGTRRGLFILTYVFFAMMIFAACSGEAAAAGAALAAKTAADLFLVLPALRAFHRRSLLAMLLIYEVYAVATTLIFPPLVLLHPRVTWKNRRVANEKAPRSTEGFS
jgi:1,2-diacylglycerol 3-beta-glucosyltransferase